MKCSQIKCIVNTVSVHGRLRPGRLKKSRPDGVVCEQNQALLEYRETRLDTFRVSA